MATMKKWITSPANLFLVLSLIAVIGVPIVLYWNEQRFTKPTIKITVDNVDKLELITHLRVYSAEWRNRWGTEIQFSDDSRILSLSTLDGAAVWDVTEGRELLRVKHDNICDEKRCENLGRKNWPPPNSHAQDVSPNGKWLALGIARADFNDLQLWEIESGQMIRSFGRNSGLQALSFSPDGSYLIFTSQDETNTCVGLCAWHIPTDEIIRIDDADINQDVSVQLDFTADGQTLIYSAPDGIHSFELETREQRQLFSNPYPVISLDLAPDDARIAVMNGIWGHTATHFQVWDVVTSELLYEGFHGIGSHVIQLGFSPNSSLLLASVQSCATRVWDAEIGTELHNLRGACNWFRFSPDGEFVVSKAGQITINDLQTGEVILSMESNNYFIGDVVAFNPDGTMLVTSEGEIWGVPQQSQ